MYRSDEVVGWFYGWAVRFIEDNDLWDEVVNIVTDENGRVAKIWH